MSRRTEHAVPQEEFLGVADMGPMGHMGPYVLATLDTHSMSAGYS